MVKGKNLLLCSTLVALSSLGVMNVEAANIADWTSLKTCLTTEGETCILQNSISATDALTINSNSATLDLNGYTLTLGTGATNLAVEVTGSGKLTVNDSKTTGAIASGHRAFNINAGGTLIINDGTISNVNPAGGSAISATGTGTDTDVITTLTIGKNAVVTGTNGIGVLQSTGTNASYDLVINVYGTVTGRTNTTGEWGHVGISISGNIKATTGDIPTINIYDGAIISGAKGTYGDSNYDDAPAIYQAGYVKTVITGGTFTGCEALSVKSGILDITGGTFTATGSYTAPAVANGNGSEATGAAISITKTASYAGNVKASIKNAVVVSQNGYAIYEGSSTGNTGSAVNSINVISGTFTGNQTVGAVYSEHQTNFVEGGEFNTPLSATYMPSNTTSVLENGVYLVGEKHNINITSGENGIITSSLSEAIEGQTVTITVTPKKGYQLKSIDGATVTKVNDTTYTFTMTNSDVTLTPVFEETPVANPKTLDSIYISIIICALSTAALLYNNKKSYKLN